MVRSGARAAWTTPIFLGVVLDVAVVGCSSPYSAGPRPEDAGTTGDRSSSFCQRRQPVPTFCDDFERADLLGGWTLNHGADALVLDHGSLQVSAPPLGDAGASPSLVLGRRFGAMPK